MEYFNRYVSNTLAGSGNQFFFYNEEKENVRSCTLYKVAQGGEFLYSFLFSNTIDSTFGKGDVSYKNLLLDRWTLEEMRVGITSRCNASFFEYPKKMHPVLFEGEKKKVVTPGALFATDPVSLRAESGEYLCVEIVFSGSQIPCHKESGIPSFVFQKGTWVPSRNHPFVSMVGAARPAKKKIAFLGDSITQGIGTENNSYQHWNAVLAEHLGFDYAYWNLGLGYGRAEDAASDGIWLYKAKQNEMVFVCYGVNDLLQGAAAEEMKENLQKIATLLHEAGAYVVMQTIPPFDYSAELKEKWEEVNSFIKTKIEHVDFVFDCVPVLAKSEADPHRVKYGKHPNAEGCKLWGEALFQAVSPLF